MTRIVNFLKSKSFALLLFHFGVLLFNWPLLSLSSEKGNTSVFNYLLITWALIVIILILVSQAILRGENDREGD